MARPQQKQFRREKKRLEREAADAQKRQASVASTGYGGDSSIDLGIGTARSVKELVETVESAHVERSEGGATGSMAATVPASRSSHLPSIPSASKLTAKGGSDSSGAARAVAGNGQSSQPRSDPIRNEAATVEAPPSVNPYSRSSAPAAAVHVDADGFYDLGDEGAGSGDEEWAAAFEADAEIALEGEEVEEDEEVHDDGNDTFDDEVTSYVRPAAQRQTGYDLTGGYTEPELTELDHANIELLKATMPNGAPVSGYGAAAAASMTVEAKAEALHEHDAAASGFGPVSKRSMKRKRAEERRQEEEEANEEIDDVGEQERPLGAGRRDKGQGKGKGRDHGPGTGPSVLPVAVLGDDWDGEVLDGATYLATVQYVPPFSLTPSVGSCAARQGMEEKLHLLPFLCVSHAVSRDPHSFCRRDNQSLPLYTRVANPYSRDPPSEPDTGTYVGDEAEDDYPPAIGPAAYPPNMQGSQYTQTQGRKSKKKKKSHATHQAAAADSDKVQPTRHPALPKDSWAILNPLHFKAFKEVRVISAHRISPRHTI